MVVKKDGRRQPFDRAKLRGSIQTACAKRPISAETIERMVDQIESALRKRDGLELLDAGAALDAVSIPGALDAGHESTAQLWPHIHGTDAMFLALIRKKA
jgi:hypothetical protein